MGRIASVVGGAAICALFFSEAMAAETVSEKVSIPVGLHPLVTTSEKYPVNTVYWPCPPERRGTAPDPASPGFNRVGWTHIYDDGSGPMPCKYRLNHVQRLVTTFELGPIEKHLPSAIVDSAFLSFEKKRVAGDHECNDQILTVVAGDAPIRPNVEDRWELAVPKLGSPDCTGSRCSINIKSQLNEWLRQPGSNMGLALIGDQERLDANDNVACLTEYGNFRMEVAYRYDVAKGSIVVPVLPKAIELLRKELTVTFVRRTTSEAIYDLTWNRSSAGGTVEIQRNGAVVQTTSDDGSQRDRAPLGTVRYKICRAGICSNEVTVTTS